MNYNKRYNYLFVLLGLFIAINLQAKERQLLADSNPVHKTSYANITQDIDNTGSGSVYQDPHDNDKVERLKGNDKLGVGMAITALAVVFAGLIGLYLLFNIIGSWGLSLAHKRVMKKYGMSKEEAKGIAQQSGEIYAAIAMAIYDATEMHDDENTILTIKNTVRNYSPWSSKIYTLRETPKK